jgi:hypothetical protein
LSLALQASPLLPDLSQTYGEVITAFFIKALSSFSGVILLCEAGLGYEAGLIVRSLFNLSILVKWTEQDQEKRSRLFLGWFWKERIDSVNNIRPPTAMEQAAWDKVKYLFEHTDKKGQKRLVKNWYGNAKISDLAASLGAEAKLHYEECYVPLSHIEHSNPIASSAFLARAKGRYLIGYLLSDEAIHEALKGDFSISTRFFAHGICTLVQSLRASSRSCFEPVKNTSSDLMTRRQEGKSLRQR